MTTDTEILECAVSLAAERGLTFLGSMVIDADGDPWSMTELALEVAARLGYSDTQERDDHGRFGLGGGGTTTKEKSDKTRDGKSVGSLTKNGGMIVSGGKEVKIGDKVTVYGSNVIDALMAPNGQRGRVVEIDQGVGVRIKGNGEVAVKAADIAKGWSKNADVQVGVATFFVDHHEQLAHEAALFNAFFGGHGVKRVADAGEWIPSMAWLAYSEGQSRDSSGRFGEGDGGAKSAEPRVGTGQSGASSFDHLPLEQQEHLMDMADKWGVDPLELDLAANELLDMAMTTGAGDAGAGWYEARMAEGVGYAARNGVTEDTWHGVVAALSPRCAWDTASGSQPNLEHAETMAKLWNENPELPSGDRLHDVDAKTGMQGLRDMGALRDSAGAIIGQNATNALTILGGKPPGDALNGNKTRSFYEQMATGGKGGTATIDVWMLAALSGRAPAKMGGPDVGNQDRGRIDVHVLDAGRTNDQKLIEGGWDHQATLYSLFDRAVVDAANARGVSVSDAQAMIWYQQRDFAGAATQAGARPWV